MNTDWLTCAAVADDLGVSIRTVQGWVERGEIPALKLPGGRLRIRQADYAAWQQARMTTATLDTAPHPPPTEEAT